MNIAQTALSAQLPPWSNSIAVGFEINAPSLVSGNIIVDNELQDRPVFTDGAETSPQIMGLLLDESVTFAASIAC